MPQERFEMLLTRETTRLPPTARGIIDEDYRLRWEAEMNDKLTPEDAKRIKACLPPGVEACFWKNVANMDPVTGARPSDPKPSVAVLMEADRTLGDFLERFNGSGFGAGSRVRRRIEEARGVINYMLANASGRH